MLAVASLLACGHADSADGSDSSEIAVPRMRPAPHAEANRAADEACRAGDKSACTYLRGATQAAGVGADPNDEAAAKSFDASCRAGWAKACERLGLFHEAGRGGLEKDPARARALIGGACDAGVGSACRWLGQRARGR